MKLLIGAPGFAILALIPPYMRWARPLGPIAGICICTEQVRVVSAGCR